MLLSSTLVDGIRSIRGADTKVVSKWHVAVREEGRVPISVAVVAAP